MTSDQAARIRQLQSLLKLGNQDKVRRLITKIKSGATMSETLLEACICLLKDGQGYEEEALDLFGRGLAQKPSYAEKAMSLVLGLELHNKDPLVERFLKVGLVYVPDNLQLNHELALLYSRSEKFDLAEAIFLNTLEKSGAKFEILVNLSCLYLKMNRFHDGIACSQLAIETNPNSELGYYNLGAILHLSGNYADSVKYFEKAYELSPGNTEVLLSLGSLYLKAGNFKQGWQCFEKRWEITKFKNGMNIPLPLWQGEPLEGKGILVWSKEGLGDHIMYASLFQKIIDMGGQLSLISNDRLKNIFCNSIPIINYFEYSNDDRKLDISGCFDYHAPMESLGVYLIQSVDDFGEGRAYLKADIELTTVYAQQLYKQFPGKKLIGFTWRGGLSDTRKYARDTGLHHWKCMMSNPDYQFINLQYNCDKEDIDLVEQFGGYTSELDCKNDMDGMAAMIGALDLVISADNTTVHLAGALGAPVWNLVPFSSDWRWFFEEEKSYWYSSMRLFHQQKPSEWKGCLDMVEKALSSESTAKR
jgi:tetratricopeptide (TPR) repeat protein